MEKRPLFVAFTNQKGGVGKSAVTVLVASWFHYVKGKNVLVVDCDYPQHSILGMRERDRESVLKSESYKQLLMAQFERTGKKSYPILKSIPPEARQAVDGYIEETGQQFDLVLFDLPGTVSTAGVLTTLFNMDYAFIPIVSDRMVMQSSMVFASSIRNYISAHPETPLCGVYLFWNRVQNRSSKEVFEQYGGILKELGINVLETVLPDSPRYSRELSNSGGKPFFRSTVHPPSASLLAGSRLEEFAGEMARITGLEID
jgi:cellulose biosynthesis protein BcsQ